METVLFVEFINMLAYRNYSNTYIQVFKNIMNDQRFNVLDIIESNVKDIDVNKYKTICFGYASLYFWHRYNKQFKQFRDMVKEKNEYLCKIKNKFFIIQDTHSYTYDIPELCKFLNNNNINIIFSCYTNNESEQIRILTPNIKHYFLPHCIDTKIFTNLNLKKEYDILLYGVTTAKHYPFRRRLFKLISKKSHLFKIYYISCKAAKDSKHYLNGLAKLINLSKICIATCSKYDYLVGKYFEIPACKSYLAGNMATDGKNIFNGRYLELNEKMNDDEIISKLKNCIDTYDQYSNHIDEMHNIITNEYNLEKYKDKLHNILCVI